MGVGEGIGSDGPGGRDWRRKGEREEEREGGGEEVRTGGFLFLFCLNKRLRGFLSPFFPPFGVFGWVLFGYVLCLCCLPLSPAFSLLLCGGVVACCCRLPLAARSLARFLSPLRKGMERPSSKLRARTGRFVDIWSFYSLSPLLILLPQSSSPTFIPHPSLAFSLSLSTPPTHPSNPHQNK
jgi:hypothetical protein